MHKKDTVDSVKIAQMLNSNKDNDSNNCTFLSNYCEEMRICGCYIVYCNGAILHLRRPDGQMGLKVKILSNDDYTLSSYGRKS